MSTRKQQLVAFTQSLTNTPLLVSHPTPRDCNLLAQSKAGSGKTGCFVLGMLGHVDPTDKNVQGICLTPTRELAFQIHGVRQHNVWQRYETCCDAH